MAQPTSYYAHGKLLLTGEYAVLDGAVALAVPSKLGQRLDIVATQSDQRPYLTWNSYAFNGECWFSAKFDVQNGNCLESSDATIAQRLEQLLQAISRQCPDFLAAYRASQISTHLEFPRLWGLGTSSTLVHLLAQWADIDPFPLQFEVFGGSGYDIACAGANQAILYQKRNGKPMVQPVNFQPAFTHQLYFVYLGKKQDSRKGIAQYRTNSQQQDQLVNQITVLTDNLLKATDLKAAEKVLLAHEQLIADAIQMERVQNLYFSDYWGVVKSLGAWGGDFVLATSERTPVETIQYFRDKGFDTVLPYHDLLL